MLLVSLSIVKANFDRPMAERVALLLLIYSALSRKLLPMCGIVSEGGEMLHWKFVTSGDREVCCSAYRKHSRSSLPA